MLFFFIWNETQGSWDRALVVVLADGAIIKQRVSSACCDIAPGHSSILLWDTFPVHFLEFLSVCIYCTARYSTVHYSSDKRPLARALDPNKAGIAQQVGPMEYPITQPSPRRNMYTRYRLLAPVHSVCDGATNGDGARAR